MAESIWRAWPSKPNFSFGRSDLKRIIAPHVTARITNDDTHFHVEPRKTIEDVRAGKSALYHLDTYEAAWEAGDISRAILHAMQFAVSLYEIERKVLRRNTRLGKRKLKDLTRHRSKNIMSRTRRQT